MSEGWRPIPGWEGLYEVSDLGRVRSLDHLGRRQFHAGRVLKPRRSGQMGYLAVGLHRDGVKADRYIHSLVLLTFVGDRPPGMQVRHLNGDNLDNRIANLAWGTPQENASDKLRHGTFRTRSTVATHCKWNHEFNADNTIRDSRGMRQCRECRRRRDREGQKRRRDNRKGILGG